MIVHLTVLHKRKLESICVFNGQIMLNVCECIVFREINLQNYNKRISVINSYKINFQ